MDARRHPGPARVSPGGRGLRARRCARCRLDRGLVLGKLLEAAIATLGAEAREGPITRELVLKGLGLVRKETLGGLAPPITFSPGQARAPEIHCVYYELLTADGWVAPRGSRPVCA